VCIRVIYYVCTILCVYCTVCMCVCVCLCACVCLCVCVGGGWGIEHLRSAVYIRVPICGACVWRVKTHSALHFCTSNASVLASTWLLNVCSSACQGQEGSGGFWWWGVCNSLHRHQIVYPQRCVAGPRRGIIKALQVRLQGLLKSCVGEVPLRLPAFYVA